MEPRTARHDLPRPIEPAVKWCLLAGTLIALGAWELFFRAELIGLPTSAAHRLDVLISIGLILAGVMASFLVIERAELRLAAAAARLWEDKRKLQELEHRRDLEILNLAGDLAVTLAEITVRCEEARHLRRDEDAARALEGMDRRMGTLQDVVRSLVVLRAAAEDLEAEPPLLEEYRRYREAHPV